ncbi:MAG: urease accessory protein UreF [Geobacteraceae bacterium GWC2_58_44]|nr:MAG: urease accessory protein UreF [Geobacteraceae bacterium GWC2_58_44]HBG03972.1 urease accessory protein UreF [Geobacter sp.]
MQLTAPALLRLLQLVSPALPVGTYSYSQGLEWAIEEGTVHDRLSATRWIHDSLHFSVGRFEAPVWLRLHQAWLSGSMEQVGYWNGILLTTRESSEFRAETMQMGYSLARLLSDLGALERESLELLERVSPITFAAAFAFAAATWRIPAAEGLLGYLWSWLENQVSASLKAVPLGQVAGQQILNEVGASLPALVEHVMILPDESLSNATPALAIASCRHETQYSRLFRS